MQKIKIFIKTSLLGGVAVILPVVILLLIFRWLFSWITAIIQPLTSLVIARGHFQVFVADFLVIAVILTGCFVVGALVKTRVGRFIQDNLENRILRIAPGYPTIKSIVMQFIGKGKSFFSAVALVQAFENDTLMTAFVTDTHADGSYTVFVPLGPNLTTGLVMHLKKQYVHLLNVRVEEAFKSVIGCGAGSAKLLKAYTENKPLSEHCSK
jgi:uncharacterized membrane protein